jgi:hypothetical protein
MRGRRPLVVRFWIVAVTLLLAVGASRMTAARPPKSGAAPTSEDRGGGGKPPEAGAALLRLVLPQLDEIRDCHGRELVKDARVAGEVIVHAIVEASGKIIEAVPYGVSAEKTRDGSAWEAMRRRVAPCVTKRIAALHLPPFSDGLARKLVIAFRFAPAAAAAVAATAAAGAPREVSVGPGTEVLHLVSAVVSGDAIAYVRQPAQLIHRSCWKIETDREGCSVRFVTLPRQVKKELSIYKPGEATKDGDKQARETDAWLRLADLLPETPVIELKPIEWPDDAAAMVLPDLGLALSAAGGHIDIARAGPDGEEMPAARLELRGGRAAHLVAVHWAPDAPVAAIVTRRPASPGLGDPAAATSVTDFETIGLGH